LEPSSTKRHVPSTKRIRSCRSREATIGGSSMRSSAATSRSSMRPPLSSRSRPPNGRRHRAPRQGARVARRRACRQRRLVLLRPARVAALTRVRLRRLGGLRSPLFLAGSVDPRPVLVADSFEPSYELPFELIMPLAPDSEAAPCVPAVPSPAPEGHSTARGGRANRRGLVALIEDFPEAVH